MSDKDEIKQLGIGLAKAAIGAVPVAGGLFNQLFFDVRGKVKQARYNSFVDALAEYMNSHFKVELTIGQIEAEQVGDFFESVISRVLKTGNQQRVDALKRLVASKIVEPVEIDYADALADLIAGLSDHEILMLQRIVEDGGSYADHYSDYHSHNRELEMLESRKRERQILNSDDEGNWTQTSADANLERLVEEQREKVDEAKKYLEPLMAPYAPATYNLQPSDYHFHLTQLIRKGIVSDESGGLGASASTVISPNQVAFDIVKFLSDVPTKEPSEDK